MKLKLIEPTVDLASAYLEMRKDWEATGEPLAPFPLRYDCNDFPAMINKIITEKTADKPDWVNNSTFWLVNEANQIVGMSNIRHTLTEGLLLEGGHIGYGIRPTFRRRGYATKILELSLIEAKKLGINKVLVTCDKDNIGSVKTIVKNGGKLWKEHILKGVAKLNFWIEN